MAQHSESGRIVVTLEPKLKRRLYAALSMSGSTMKDWFTGVAEEYCGNNDQRSSNRMSTVRKAEMISSSTQRRPSTKPLFLKTDGAAKKLAGHASLVSMFSGCGGMDLGFKGGFEIFGRRYRSLPFNIVWANELNTKACDTYERNLGHHIHRGDVWQFMDTLPASADVLIGGFPCQDISVNGKRAGVNGTRSGLYKAMVEAVRRTKPKVFIAENVKALLRHEDWLQQVLSDFAAIDYALHYQLYSSADFGVPQTRERVFIVGTAPGVRQFTPPTPERNASTWMTAREAIGDLEELEQSEDFSHIWSKAKLSPEQGNRRLKADRPGYTIRAECHGNIQFHYRLARRMSMREAARIQSFPDKFAFNGGIRETERQIGNAVPPVLAWHIANAVLDCVA